MLCLTIPHLTNKILQKKNIFNNITILIWYPCNRGTSFALIVYVFCPLLLQVTDGQIYSILSCMLIYYWSIITDLGKVAVHFNCKKKLETSGQIFIHSDTQRTINHIHRKSTSYLNSIIIVPSPCVWKKDMPRVCKTVYWMGKSTRVFVKITLLQEAQF